MAAVGLALATLAAPGAAEAADTRILVLAGVNEGTSAAQDKALYDAISSELDVRKKYTLLPRPEGSIIDIMFDAECIEPDVDCLKTIGAANGAEQVLFYEVEAVGPNHQLRLRVIDVKKGKAIGDEKATSSSIDRLPSEVAAPAEKLFGKKPKVKPTAPAEVKVSVTSEPTGATAYVNDAVVGATPVEFQRPAGTYSIRLSKTGYDDAIREIEVKDKELKLSVSLQETPVASAAVPVTPVSGDDGPEIYEEWWFWTAIGVGAAAAGVGIAAAAGAFDSDTSNRGNVTFIFGQSADKDFLVQGQRQ
jgi:hypothetical protein